MAGKAVSARKRKSPSSTASQPPIEKDDRCDHDNDELSPESKIKTEDDIHNLNNDVVVDARSTTTLANRIIDVFYSQHNRHQRPKDHHGKNLLKECDANGTIERCFWPWFLLCVSTPVEEAPGIPGEEMAFALAILSNRRGSIGTSSEVGGADSQLWFVVDDYDYSKGGGGVDVPGRRKRGAPLADVTPRQRTEAFALMLKLLFRYQEKYDEEANLRNKDDNDKNLLSIVIKTEIVTFLIASYFSMELRCKKPFASSDAKDSQRGIIEGPLTDLVGVRLWDAIPRRKRYLEMKRDGLLRKRYGLFQKRLTAYAVGSADEKDGSLNRNVGFLPGMVKGLLEALTYLGGDDEEGRGGNHYGFKNLSSDEENETGNDDEIDEDDDVDEVADDTQGQKKRHDSPSKSSLSFLLHAYVSKSLELLLDLLSYPQTRIHVASYLSSHQVAVKLALSKLYREKTSFVLFRHQVQGSQM